MLTHTQVEAHKVILAASGPFLHAILKKNKYPHPLVFMRGMKLEGLVNLVCSESGTQTFVESETIESEIEERCARERSLLFAHSAVTPPQLLTISRRICESIQEKNLSAAHSVNCVYCSAASLTVAPVV